MSLTKSVTRRLSLMAGSSLAAAAITAFAALTPTSAAAQATCASGTTVTGNNSNSVTIDGGNPNNPGITCTFTGDTALVSTSGAMTVSTLAPGGGINLSAGGDDSINWNSTAGTVTGSTATAASGPNGAVIEAVTNTGDISITAGGVTGSAAGVTHGIRAISSGGDITLITGAVSASNSTSGQYAIEASTSGSGAISITTTSGTVNGRLRGILASTTGTGRIELDLNGTVSGGGLEVNSGSGGAEIYIGPSGQVQSLRTSTAAGTVTEIIVDGRLQPASSSTALIHTASGAGRVHVTLLDNGVQANNRGRMRGNVDYSLLTGGAVIDIESRQNNNGWVLRAGTSYFSQGDDQINVSDTGVFGSATGVSTVDFLSGVNEISNSGLILIGDGNGASALDLRNLSTFTNDGVIIVGYYDFVSVPGANVESIYDVASDLQIDDRLILRDSRFVGEEGSRIYVDAILGATAQIDCATLTAADCVDFQGTTVEGKTLIRIRDASPSFDGLRNDGIVLVDVAGGSSSAANFDLDPGSIGYDEESTLGAVIRKGLIAYDLIYDADTEQHVLVGVVAPEGYQFQYAPALALNAWRTATGTWFDRQADLRDTLGGPGLARGMWIRAAADFTSRDAGADFVLRGRNTTFDMTHKQQTGAVTVGADLVSAESDAQGFVFGAMLGFSNSITEFDASPTKIEFTGPTGGLYASFVSGGLFLDALVNASLFNMNEDAPGLNLGEGVRLKQDLKLYGAQAEAGWRIPLGETVFVEPLAGASYVRTTFEDIDGAAANSLVDLAEEAVSARANLGLRVGVDTAWRSATVRYTLTGRAWNEFEGENALTLDLPGESLDMMDDLSGTFGEAGAGISMFDETGLVSGFFNGSMKFKDDYRSAGFSAGFRYRW